MQKAIAYYRVSTKEQEESGLGLEAQKLLVEDFARHQNYELINEFIEIESGSKNDRPQLRQALRRCKRNKAVLLIAKLDRLARNVAFIAKLIEARVDFKAVDNPHANKFMLHVMAVFAELERDLIRERTKAALHAAKLRGTELGHNGHVLARINRLKAENFARQMAPIIEAIRQNGIKTIAGMARQLNLMLISTYSGGLTKWHPRTVRMLLMRIEHERQRQIRPDVTQPKR